ncbi:MAG TPA: di-heme oxidoredictase family protein [Gammaproteobacteria bacterium]
MRISHCGPTAAIVTFAAFACALLSLPPTVRAQLPDCTLVDQALGILAPGGCIAKSLRDQIGAGQGDVATVGSSTYLIKRDPARAIRRGRQLFQRKFSAAEGVGPRVNLRGSGDITATRALGAGLADSCAACHGRPRGAAGHGGDVSTFPDSRDAPHLFGLGLIEMLADEMTADLRAIREQALQEARGPGNRPPSGRGRSVTKPLVSKGVDFGTITVFANGNVDTSGVRGVDADLRVRPFFHHGGVASIREFIIGALNDEMGLQAWDPILCAATDPQQAQSVESAAGFRYDPAGDTFNRPPACDASEDPDGDGVPGEIDPAIVDYIEFYLLNYLKPALYRQTPRTAEGLALMESIGCTSCHVRTLEIERDRRIVDVETVHDPEQGIFNELFAEVFPLFGPLDDGAAYPQLLPLGGTFAVENVFTDLKRHDLGPAFQERDYDGSRITEHVTEPLWGVGTSAPYGHDGRSVTLDAVIRRHGGEAEPVTAAYVALSADDQDKIVDFLETLVLFPPDDTASGLNPGVPGSDDPQLPENHGSINVGALFQIESEGEE